MFLYAQALLRNLCIFCKYTEILGIISILPNLNFFTLSKLANSYCKQLLSHLFG